MNPFEKCSTYLNAPAALTTTMQLAEATREQRVVIDQSLILKGRRKALKNPGWASRGDEGR